MTRRTLFHDAALMALPLLIEWDALNPRRHTDSTVQAPRHRPDSKLSNVKSAPLDPRVELYRQERQARKLAAYLKRNPNPTNPQDQRADAQEKP